LGEFYTSGGYALKNPTWHEEDSPWKASQIASILRAENLVPNSVAEIGCGAGGVISSLLNEASFEKSTGVGYDIAPDAIEIAKRKETGRLKFLCEDFFSQQTTFDLILCIDVFEHVEDYIGFLKKLRGRAIWYVFHIPLEMQISALLRQAHMKAREQFGHLHYFDRYTALETLRYTEYAVRHWRYTHGSEGLIHLHPEHEMKTKIANLVRRPLRKLIGEDLAVQLIGGSSLLVLAN
jgi:ubiquinone/menaquinone biosynthesis C-methylase UbiE